MTEITKQTLNKQNSKRRRRIRNGRSRPNRFSSGRYFRNRRMFSRVIPLRGRIQRPKLRIIYGKEQDYAFNSNPKLGMGPVFSAPISETNTIRSYFKFVNNSLTFCQPVPSKCYSSAMAIINLHPMIFYGRIANIATQFSNYSISRAVLHYVPMIGTTSVGQVAIGSTRHCLPITYNTANQFDGLTQVNAEISPVWMCTKYGVKDLDSSKDKLMEPVTRESFTNTIYVVGSGLAGNLSASAKLYLEMTMNFSRPVPLSYLTALNDIIIITLAVGGVQCDTAAPSNIYGVVRSSTVTTIDVGEFIKAPAFQAANTNYDVNIEHNGVMTNYTDGNDQGIVYLIPFYVD